MHKVMFVYIDFCEMSFKAAACSVFIPFNHSICLQDDVDDAIAEELLATAPGLFIRHPSSGKLTVTNARDHEKHLEKV